MTIQLMAHENDVNCVQFHPSDPYILASCSDDGLIKLWKVNAPGLLRKEESKLEKIQQDNSTPMQMDDS